MGEQDLNDNCYNVANDANGCCTAADQVAGSAVTAFAADTTIALRINMLANSLTPTSTGQPEKGFPIYSENSTGAYSIPQTQTASSGNLQINISIPAYPGHTPLAYVHSHPAEAYPGPSAGDIYQFIGLNNTLYSVKTAYIVAADSSKYALNITDSVKLAAFLTANPANSSVSGANFIQTSTIGLSFKTVEDSFIAQGYSDNEAYERALSTVLQNSGITLLKALKNSNSFKKIDAQQVRDSNGNPITDGNGNNMYLKVDC